MSKRTNIAVGLDYIRRDNGLTLIRKIKTLSGVTTSLITMTDEEFFAVVAIQLRYRGQDDPSLTAGDLDRVADYGYEKGGEV